jgi:hypothetical protein
MIPAMSEESTPVPAAKPNRLPLYIIGGVLLTLTVVIFWFSDRLGSLFERTPTETSIEGTWEFDSVRDKELKAQSFGSVEQMPAADKDYSKTVVTFAPGMITMNDGTNPAVPTPCRIQGYPPNAYLVTIGEGKTQREMVFQLDATTEAKRLYLSTEGSMVPFKVKTK